MKNPQARNAVAGFTLRLGQWQKWTVYGAFAALLVSGLAWLAGHYGLRVDVEIPHPLEALAMKFHGGLAMAGLVVFGSVLPVHVRLALRIRRNLGTGLAMLAVLLVLAASGYVLYYFATEDNRELLSLLHWIVGVATLPLLVWHVAFGRRG